MITNGMNGGGGVLMGGGGGGVPNSTDLLAQLMKKLQGGMDDANNAGLAQYQNLLSSVNGLEKNVVGKGGQFSQAAGLLDKAGQTATADTMQNTKNQVGHAQQDLISRGLDNTSLRSTILPGIENKGQRELNAITENVGQQKSNLLQQQAGATMDIGKLRADSILSRQNQGPDLGMYLQLIQQLAASQAASKAAQPTTMFSNQGSISALNAPSTFGGGGGGAGGASAPPATSGTYLPPGSGNTTYGALAPRPGDTYFR